MTPRKLVKLLTPPIVVQAYNTLRKKKENDLPAQTNPHLTGDYSSWAEALAASTGYDSENILEKTRLSLLKVKSGQAVYERDSVLFDKIQYAWPVLAGLMWVAAQSEGRLNVLDFGGSLGSTYFQNRHLLAHLPAVRWNIVEQPRQVEVGRAEFEDDYLKFYDDIDSCFTDTQPNVIILSGVLQYLERPFDILNKLLNASCNHLIIDRTPFWSGPSDQLCIQHVPARIYTASYPSWIFSSDHFQACLNAGWEIVAEFDDPDRLPAPVAFSYKGLIASRGGK